MENQLDYLKTLKLALGLADEDESFPWQERLLGCFLGGEIPSKIDIPTGLGKTSVMAIWLVAKAFGAALPRRLVYVVDRRAVVDQATEVALQLKGFVDASHKVKARLGLTGRSLPVSTLRGQYADNREWLDNPGNPAIIVGTVDMIGSRLLFQGYGVSRRMRAYHAGLIGVDALIVLDEAHLVPPFEALLDDIADSNVFIPKDDKDRAVVPSFKLISLSATGRRTGKAPFGLKRDDLNHPAVQQRLKARKQLTIHELQDGKKLVDTMAEKAWGLSSGGKQPVRCIIFCDKRTDALKCKEAIERSAAGVLKPSEEVVEVDTELFVGGRRVYERQEAVARLNELGFLAGTKVIRHRAAFLFATSPPRLVWTLMPIAWCVTSWPGRGWCSDLGE